ncbi:MAG: Gfo/Idh/MocA family oxidoreductase, partial [Thermoanaerobaculia bacterium]
MPGTAGKRSAAVIGWVDAQAAQNRSFEHSRRKAADVYSDYRELARAEAARADGAEVVAIVVPNHLYHPVARACLEVGLHVVCDKPL